jgi:polysaccharide export outer membrane protein
VSGCATLPTDGPTGHQVAKDVARTGPAFGYQIVDINLQNASQLSRPIDGGALSTLAADLPVDTLGPGDILSVEIFEVGAGLFSGGRTLMGSTTEEAPLPLASGQGVGSGGIIVDRDGSITVPYVGRIEVAGLTTSQVQDKILAGLRGKSQSPQVIVTRRENLSSTVVMMGAVQRPGRLPLTLANDHLLDAIAESGGISTSIASGSSTATGTGPQDMVIRFTRGGRSVTQALDTVLAGSPDDLLLQPGDHIDVIRQPRTFTIYGAIDRIAQMPFESQRLSLAEALARAGGPSDARADPRSIFVFRLLQPVDVPLRGEPSKPPTAVVYRLNMMQASSYFAAQQFTMHDKDIIYIANASSNLPTKLVQIINLLFTPVYSVRAATQ